MRKTLFAGALIMASLGCGQDDAAGPSAQFQIEGRVLDDLTGRGIAKAQVRFSSDALDRAETDSDADGRFTLEVSVRDGVAFGLVNAEHEQYESPAARSVYFDGTTHVIDLRLRAKSRAK